ncbi:MAG TPA: hypothetical protein VGR18_12055 [Rubrobacter sp.]|nr:hypothetical protein [Rubrobacter sp.]
MLGRFEVAVGPRVVGEEGWRLRKAASLVKLLGLAPYHRLHREQVMELLWPDLSPSSAANNLHQTLHAARRTLQPSAADFRYLILRDELLFLCPDGAPAGGHGRLRGLALTGPQDGGGARPGPASGDAHPSESAP